MDIIAYLPAIVGFAAAIVAIVGAPKWDSAQSGAKRLTKAGRVVLALAVLVLIASSVLTWRAQNAAETERASRERVNLIAHTELRLALRQLSGPFAEILWEAGQEELWQEFDIVPTNILETQNRAALASLDLNSRSPYTPPVGPPLRWGDAIAESSRAANSQIDRVLQVYAAYLDANILALISDLRTSEFFEIRLLRMNEFLEMNATTFDHPLYFEYAAPNSDRPFGYEHFWNVMHQLDESLLKDEERLRRWGKK